MKALPKILLALTGVAALSLAHPASVQAVPTTYQYTGNHFTDVTGPYTTSMFVTAKVTLAGPLGANMPLTDVTPTAFTFFDGVQTITNHTAFDVLFQFATDATSTITFWNVGANPGDFPHIFTFNDPTDPFNRRDEGLDVNIDFGANFASPGVWTVNASVPDGGSTLSLMTLTLMALGLVARRFQRAAG
jgi:hypothetical protein